MGVSRGVGPKAQAHSSAYREDAFNEFTGTIGTPKELEGDYKPDDPGTVRIWEEQLSKKFKSELNLAGLTIPSPSPAVTSEEDPQPTNFSPPIESWPLWALARHHGIPTTLLDWTRKPMAAAYFAAAKAAEECAPDASGDFGKLAIWAIVRPEANCICRFAGHGNLQFYQPPSSTNPNLHAQAGLFTILHDRSMLAVDEYIRELGDKVTSPFRQFSPPIMRLFTLSKRHAPKLLKFLSDEGFNGATLFPGYDGIVKKMKEESLLKRYEVETDIQ